MYLAHYGLKKKPFDISPNPEFLWLGEKHREGLAILKYGILENKGFLLITGDVGTGKTALIRAIEKELQARAIVVTIPDPGMTLMDFYNFMAAELNMDRSFANKGDFLIHFKRLILSAFASYRRVLLIIDESQRLNHDLMEEIRLLSNPQSQGAALRCNSGAGRRASAASIHTSGDRWCRSWSPASGSSPVLHSTTHPSIWKTPWRVCGTWMRMFASVPAPVQSSRLPLRAAFRSDG